MDGAASSVEVTVDMTGSGLEVTSRHVVFT